MPYKWVIDTVIVAILVAAAVWGIHLYNDHQQQIGAARVQALWDADKLTQAKARAELTAQYQKEKDNALAQAAKNTQAANAAAAAATESGRVLDGTIKAILASSSVASVEANRRYTTALAEVFGDCKNRYRELGQKAQGHADDALMFDNSWPK